ncbi:MAG TPA: hypothetical protein VED37_17405 [Ktedonobacteraceae bacterium]|nr:hypothetical protein [Ktedonobacteraceae bacterium]
MIPDSMDNYFIASTGASAALVGLLFVSISLWPREKMRSAPRAWRAVAGGSFFAFVNVFLISLSALITGFHLGWLVLVIGLLGIGNSLLLGLPLLRPTPDWKEHSSVLLANLVMVFYGLALYLAEVYFGIRLLLVPADALAVEGIAQVLLLLYALGLIRAWELLGIEQIGPRKWLNPLQVLSRSEIKQEDHEEGRSISNDHQE